MQTLVDWLLSRTLVYRVEFVRGGPNVVVNAIGAALPLWVAASTDPGQHEHPPKGVLQTPQTDALELEITKLPDDPAPAKPRKVVVTCELWPAPAPILSGFGFTMMCNGRLHSAVSPLGIDAMWAVMLVARDGEKLNEALNSDTNDPDGDAIVGATHQVRDGGQIALGAASARPVTPKIASEKIDFLTAYPPRKERRFTLASDFDWSSGRGYSRLRTPGHRWLERTWPIPFMSGSSPVPASPPTEMARSAVPQIKGVGVALAMIKGSGTPGVTIDDFSIYIWNEGPRRWWQQWILGAMGSV
jgi:hypothetical protein